MKNITFHEITEPDLAAIREIYNFYILNSTSTYYTEIITIQELKEFIPLGNNKYKSYLIRDSHEPIGFCYLSPYKKRQAYDRTAEVSIYLKNGFTGKGIGMLALEKLEQDAVKNGISVLIGIISADNTGSVRLFEKCGYVKCGHLREVGEKFNRVLDVTFYQKLLNLK